MKIKKIKVEELTKLELNKFLGGGEPVPGAEIFIELEPDEQPIIKDNGTDIDALRK